MGAGQRGLLFSLKICLIGGFDGREEMYVCETAGFEIGEIYRRADVTNVCFSGVW